MGIRRLILIIVVGIVVAVIARAQAAGIVPLLGL
jgi:hypothetical protein